VDPKQAEDYFRNLLEIRETALKHDLPFWNIVSSNQIRPDMPGPSPANLLMQAYTTLAAGAKGLTWYTYYDRGYHYAPVDKAGHRSRTWGYVKMVNEQVKVLGPIMMLLKSTGVHFSDAAPAASQPVLPGEIIESVTAAPAAAAMVGEFADEAGRPFVMLVNLNLERSSHFTLKARKPYQRMLACSPADGSFAATAEPDSIWLPAGQGVLLRFE